MAPSKPHRIFLLSPARIGGARSAMLLREQAEFDVAVRLRQGRASIGEVYAFISGLYFRGKLAYVEAFGDVREGVPPAVVMVPGFGLVPPGAVLNTEQLVSTGRVEVDEGNEAF